MGHIWVLYGQKSLYGAHVGLEWEKCPDSAHMGPLYTCLLGSYKKTVYTQRRFDVDVTATSKRHCLLESVYIILNFVVENLLLHTT